MPKIWDYNDKKWLTNRLTSLTKAVSWINASVACAKSLQQNTQTTQFTLICVSRVDIAERGHPVSGIYFEPGSEHILFPFQQLYHVILRTHSSIRNTDYEMLDDFKYKRHELFAV